jgi:hypothetical protein
MYNVKKTYAAVGVTSVRTFGNKDFLLDISSLAYGKGLLCQEMPAISSLLCMDFNQDDKEGESVHMYQGISYFEWKSYVWRQKHEVP